VSIVPPAIRHSAKRGARSNKEVNMKGRFSIFVGMVALLTGAGLVIAQEDPGDEYEEWQKASREEQREHQEYLKNPKKSNYLDWRSAQRDANREYEEYKLSLEMSQGYPYPYRRNVIVVGKTQPRRDVIVVREPARSAVVVNGDGRYVDGTRVGYVNGNGMRAYVKGNAACGTGTAYLNGNRSLYVNAAMNGNGLDEYEEWAAAEREVLREHREFISHPTDDNFAGWKEAQLDACREYAEYRAAAPIGSAAYTSAVYTAPIVRTSYVRRAPVRRVRAKRVKRCYCR